MKNLVALTKMVQVMVHHCFIQTFAMLLDFSLSHQAKVQNVQGLLFQVRSAMFYDPRMFQLDSTFLQFHYQVEAVLSISI